MEGGRGEKDMWVDESPPLNMTNGKERPNKKRGLCGEEDKRKRREEREERKKPKWKVCVGREERKPE